MWLSPRPADSAQPFNPRLLFIYLFFVQVHPQLWHRCGCDAASSSAGRRPSVFSILPHLAFRHATMTQWCRVTGQAGHWLFVSIQINHSLFWTDNAINVWKGHEVRSSQAWWGEWWGQRGNGNTLDWATCIFTRRRRRRNKRKNPLWSSFCEQDLTIDFVCLFEFSCNQGHVRGLAFSLSYWLILQWSAGVPHMWQGLYPLMIRVNMAHSLHFCGKVRKKNTTQ